MAARVWAGTFFNWTAAFLGLGSSLLDLYLDGITNATLYLHHRVDFGREAKVRLVL